MARPTARIDRRKLKQPDEFITWMGKAWKYVQAHWKRVASVAGGILLLIILISVYRMHRARQETRAASMVAEAIEGFSNDPSQAAPFERIQKEFSGTQGARLARLYLGHVLYRKGEADKAAEAYGALADDSTTREPVRSQAILGRGYALVALKRCNDAESAFKKLPSSSALGQQEAFLAIGRCYELKGDRAAAIKRYQEFAGKFPQSPFLTDALRSKIKSFKKSTASNN